MREIWEDYLKPGVPGMSGSGVQKWDNGVEGWENGGYKSRGDLITHVAYCNMMRNVTRRRIL